MEDKLKYSFSFLLVAFFLLITNACATTDRNDTISMILGEENDSDQCKDVIQDNLEFQYCLKAISQKWPAELAVLPCCRQFKKMDETCRCQAVKLIVNAAIAAAAPSEGDGNGDADAEPIETAK
ncbi:hypothetical protein ACH5RR_027928 [Cinchona calisaya]|uniref:Bifunctional inhibitor/plant lipid transfer protein/seed storage helical domain-containing protein n=1 Tax=Cinchona calisaya TaxID=153742 RepID=A0ABD2YMB2_9GENT